MYREHFANYAHFIVNPLLLFTNNIAHRKRDYLNAKCFVLFCGLPACGLVVCGSSINSR